LFYHPFLKNQKGKKVFWDTVFATLERLGQTKIFDMVMTLMVVIVKFAYFDIKILANKLDP